jgi:crotonobetainyl-CoA:carnitine CoA-transferase CaiB-like acyl-CoA transferase
MPPIRLSDAAVHAGGAIGRAAPCLGEDNRYVLGELLGLAPEEIDALERDGVAA